MNGHSRLRTAWREWLEGLVMGTRLDFLALLVSDGAVL